MPIAYERDDQRRLISVTIVAPFSLNDILGMIDRQAAEDTWGYATLYDLRAVTQPLTDDDLRQMADRLKVVGGGRQRGPVGVAIRALPALFRAGVMFTKLTREFVTVEVLLNAAQLDAWLTRSTRRDSHLP